MSLNWLANTSQGTMVGDYIATAFSGGSAHPVVALANAPNGGLLDEATYTAASTLAGLAAAAPLAEANAPPVLSTAPDHPRRRAPAIRR